jgi:hypothetical protein
MTDQKKDARERIKEMLEEAECNRSLKAILYRPKEEKGKDDKEKKSLKAGFLK